MDLPELHTGELDRATFDALISDLIAHAEVLDVLVKGSAEQHSDGRPVPLLDAAAMLLRGAARGIQIRYRWDGAEWRDTLIAQGGRVRIVRTQWTGTSIA